MSEQSFADLGVSSAVEAALNKRGFAAPFAIQKKVIGDVLAGRDVLAKSPTGSGKTLAFMVPTIDRIDAEDPRPAALILAPTRELATQIVEETYPIAHAKALKVLAVYGGVSLDKQIREAKKSHIVVATPGRLEDLLQRRAFNLNNIKILVLDEADRMLDMGFRPAVDRVVSLCPSDRQTLFFSATLDGEAGKIAKEYTSDAVRHEHIAPQQKAADIEHQFVKVNGDAKVDRLIAEIGDQWDLSLVFVRTKRGADRLVKRLQSKGIKAGAMHGDKTQRQRERALADFEAGRTTTLIATDVAARGIHVDAISKVINFDPPGQTEDYVHRVGRTGRAGARGIAVTFVSSDQVRDLKRMTRELRLEREFDQATANGRTAPVQIERGPDERPRREERPSRDERSNSGDRPRHKAGESNGEQRSTGGKPRRQQRNAKSGVGKSSNGSKTHRKGQGGYKGANNGNSEGQGGQGGSGESRSPSHSNANGNEKPGGNNRHGDSNQSNSNGSSNGGGNRDGQGPKGQRPSKRGPKKQTVSVGSRWE
ncbi:MAG: DEAD/DEAH box helicase [Solirubrobacterales bacterium]|nr:DEAD/DEAH box helicase [Solirubrobacterales bacterium]